MTKKEIKDFLKLNENEYTRTYGGPMNVDLKGNFIASNANTKKIKKREISY